MAVVTKIVVDASVSAQWYLVQQNTNAALRLFEHDIELVAPDIITAEVASVVWKACRRKTVDEMQAARILREFLAVNIRLVPAEQLAEQALDLALRHGQTVYDCMYLALALREECQFVTADAEFYKAVERALPSNILWVEDIPAASR